MNELCCTWKAALSSPQGHNVQKECGKSCSSQKALMRQTDVQGKANGKYSFFPYTCCLFRCRCTFKWLQHGLCPCKKTVGQHFPCTLIEGYFFCWYWHGKQIEPCSCIINLCNRIYKKTAMNGLVKEELMKLRNLDKCSSWTFGVQHLFLSAHGLEEKKEKAFKRNFSLHAMPGVVCLSEFYALSTCSVWCIKES